MSLIDLAIIKHYHDVSSHLGRKAKSNIRNAERLDVKPLLGEKMYLDMVQNKADDNYKLLLDGGEYVCDDGKGDFTYTFCGLTEVLVEFAYSRIIFFGSESQSPHGLVDKLSADTRHITRDRKKEIYTASRQTANELWREVLTFLERKSEDYKYWDVCEVDQSKIEGFKIKHIR